jgi:hypothetical protein
MLPLEGLNVDNLEAVFSLSVVRQEGCGFIQNPEW